jgi:mono/diheme cytochrome c family protein
MKWIAHSTLGVVVGFSFSCAVRSEPSAEPATASTQPLTGDQMLEPTGNATGSAQTAASTGAIDTGNAYFQSLGVNGRTCGSCHVAEQGWTVTPDGLRARFDATGGTDPIFRPHDGATSPLAAVSTESERRNAYALLLSRGVVRVGLPMKPTFEFTLVAVDDPYGWASATQLSLFRRPLPTTNLRFLSAINWDGRSTPAADLTNIHLGLKNQSNGATVNHAQATAPIADDVRESIVAFETSLTTAQVKNGDLRLDSANATGGPAGLLTQPFAIGMNEPGQPGSTNRVFTLFDAWSDSANAGINEQRRDIAEGQRVFNEKTFTTGPGRTGTCSGCHNTPNVGSSSVFRFFDVGVSSATERSSDLPLYTFVNTATGETIQSTDPGRALISGKWAGMNRFKVPGLRGLAARAPYFHDGSARTIDKVVDHYEKHFSIEWRGDEKKQLVAFLSSL